MAPPWGGTYPQPPSPDLDASNLRRTTRHPENVPGSASAEPARSLLGLPFGKRLVLNTLNQSQSSTLPKLPSTRTSTSHDTHESVIMSWLGVQPLKKFNAPFCASNCDSFPLARAIPLTPE